MYAPKEKFAEWLEVYAALQDLVIWTSSEILDVPRPTYDGPAGRWTVSISRAGKTVVLRPTHIVLATGTLGPPSMPFVPGADTFNGEILHASTFSGAEAFAGKRVLVVGAANTAADVCKDLHYTGASAVTMLQRGSTCVISAALVRAYYGSMYPEGVPFEVGDFRHSAGLWGLREMEMKAALAQGDGPKDSDEDAKMKEGLREKGFRINEGRDGLGVGFLIVERFAGACRECSHAGQPY